MKDYLEKVQSSKLDAELSGKNQELREVDERICDMNEEMASLNRQADTRARLGMKKSERVKKQATLAELLEDSKAEFRRTFGTSPVIATMESDVAMLLR